MKIIYNVSIWTVHLCRELDKQNDDRSVITVSFALSDVFGWGNTTFDVALIWILKCQQQLLQSNRLISWHRNSTSIRLHAAASIECRKSRWISSRLLCIDSDDFTAAISRILISNYTIYIYWSQHCVRHTNRMCSEVLMNGFSETELVSSGQIFVLFNPEANSMLKKQSNSSLSWNFYTHSTLVYCDTPLEEFQFLSRITKQT